MDSCSQEENTNIRVADVLCDLCSKCPVEFFAETMSQPVVSLQLVGLALMRASTSDSSLKMSDGSRNFGARDSMFRSLDSRE